MKRPPKVKLGLRNQTMAQRFAICGRIVDAIARLPEAERARFDLERLNEARTAAEQADRDVNNLTAQLKAATLRRKQNLKKYCHEVSMAGLLVSIDAKSEGDIAKHGLSVERPKLRLPAPDAPAQFRSLPCDKAGAVKLRWKRPCRRCWFEVQMTTDPQATSGWTQALIHTATKVEITGLQAGVLYWFRVRAGNAAGHGSWSNPVSVRPVR